MTNYIVQITFGLPPQTKGGFGVIVNSMPISFTLFWTVYELRVQRESFTPLFPVVFAPVSHLFPLGYPVSIILGPNKAQSGHFTSYF